MDPDTQAAIAAQSGGAVAGDVGAAEQTVAPEAAAKADTEDGGADSSSAADASEKVVDADGGDSKLPPADAQGTDESDGTTSTNMDETVLPSQEEVDKALESAGYSNETLGQELADNDGKISDETIANLKKHFDPTAVDNAIKDLEQQWVDAQPDRDKIVEDHKAEAAEAQKQKDDIDKMNDFIWGSLAGGDIEKGKDNLKTLSEWAKDNMDPKELELINAKLASGNKALVTEGLEQAVGQWKKGQKRPMMSGDAAANAKVQEAPKFEPLSRDEFKAIMATEKYQTDPEYAEKIDNRRRKTQETEGFMTPEYSALRPPV